MDFVSRSFPFGAFDRCIVIGEVGVNHNNTESLLFKLIDEGIAAGVDVIKLQRFKASEEISRFADSTEYQRKAGVGATQLAMAEKLELSDELLVRAFEYCKRQKIAFLCTAFDHSSVDFLADVLRVKTVKVPSPEITNKPLIEHMARKFDSLLISTGASDLSECLRVLEWVRAIGTRDVAFMHCTSQYPAPIEQANLMAIPTMRSALNRPIGYSDHTEGIVVATAAAALGAAMLEKHFTIDKNLPGPDHKASADISELKALVQSLRNVSLSLGNGVKAPAPAERENLPLIRKSFTCAVDRLKAGTVIEARMLGIKRPHVQGAVEPYEGDRIVGMTIRKDKEFDEPILWSDFRS
ncbi:MAG: N-acetylneuraminate synthase family protein [Deltaproteobacteria bacterium]|nr:N-acetylneuraminate synthase family protein [Deltaproteobacteria bacterium]MBI3295899.1 N-acetylneuraminate synthase family protein [Deltaproteobacteria bacterium]